jgi:hypothetical protein
MQFNSFEYLIFSLPIVVHVAQREAEIVMGVGMIGAQSARA